MLAVVKKPHIEMCLNGNTRDLLALMDVLRRCYDVSIIVNDEEQDVEKDDDEELVNIRDTDFWRENMTPGTVLQGYRLKHGKTQRQLAKLSGISYATISEYEHNKRRITPLAARRLAVALDENPDTFYDRLMN